METQEQRTAAPVQDEDVVVEVVEERDETVEETEETVATPLARRKRERHRAIPLMPEVRHFPASGLEVRTETASNEIIITGAPIVYDTPYTVVDLAGEFEERMSRGVARDVIARNMDVRFLFNHGGLPMARTMSGTLTLRDSPDALRFTARLDARQQLANDVAIAIERGDVSQMSVGFIPARDEWNKDMTERNVILFRDLPDISAVTYPCSTTTSIEIARRMAMEIPVESRARLRGLYAELRAGRVLSAAHQGMLLQATQALHSVLGASGADMSGLMPDSGPDADDVLDEPEVPQAGVSTVDDGSIGGGLTGAGDGTLTDPGDVPIVNRNFSNLRREVELRKRRRIAA